MLSLVLACVISSLFAKSVVEFLSTTSKKKDYQYASVLNSLKAECDDDTLFLSADHHIQSPAENHNISESNSVIPLQQFKTIRGSVFTSTEKEKYIFKSSDWYLDVFYKNTLPSRWGPTLSIAHRRLII